MREEEGPRPATAMVEILFERQALPDGMGGALPRKLRRRVERRLLDHRLWQELSEPEREAAERLQAAILLLSRGIGFRASRFDRPRVDCTTGAGADFDRPVVRDYFAWRRSAEAARLDVAAILSVAAAGESLSGTDRARRRRKGYARTMLLAGLALYCRQKGWPDRKEIS